ncbi:unnamed protein product [Phaeothamnion confervicola]
MGPTVSKAISAIIPQDRIFDLKEVGERKWSPEDKLRLFAGETDLRVLVCGGDGTMGWLFSCIDRLQGPPGRFPVAMMPLGTGNDLSRSFRWGPGFSRSMLTSRFVDKVRSAEKMELDRWLLCVMPNEPLLDADKIKATHIPPTFTVHQYCGAGGGGEVASTVQRAGQTFSQRMSLSGEEKREIFVYWGVGVAWRRAARASHRAALAVIAAMSGTQLFALRSDWSTGSLIGMEAKLQEDLDAGLSSSIHPMITGVPNSEEDAMAAAVEPPAPAAATPEDMSQAAADGGATAGVAAPSESSAGGEAAQTEPPTAAAGAFEAEGPGFAGDFMLADADTAAAAAAAAAATTQGPPVAASAADDVTPQPLAPKGSWLGYLGIGPKPGEGTGDAPGPETDSAAAGAREAEAAADTGDVTLATAETVVPAAGVSDTATLPTAAEGGAAGNKGGPSDGSSIVRGAGVLAMLHPQPSVRVSRFAPVVVQKHKLWESYDGVFCNYFSLGVDAAAAAAFHRHREAHPELFTSRARNQLWYIRKGFPAAGGFPCCSAPPPPPLRSFVTLSVRGLPGAASSDDEWVEVAVPRTARGLIVLNLQSYGGGRDLWGAAGCAAGCRPVMRQFPPSFNDGVLEVVAVSSIYDMGVVMGLNKAGAAATRICQGRELRMRIAEETYMQIDGEPWKQAAATIHIRHHARSTCLVPVKTAHADDPAQP